MLETPNQKRTHKKRKENVNPGRRKKAREKEANQKFKTLSPNLKPEGPIGPDEAYMGISKS